MKSKPKKKPREWVLVLNPSKPHSVWTKEDARRFRKFFDRDAEKIHVREVLPKKKVRK